MKAALLVDTGVIVNAELPIPELEKHEVLVKVYETGICGSDIHKMTAGWHYPFPAVMGHEISGVVIKTGDDKRKDLCGKTVVIVPFIPCKSCHYCENGMYSLCMSHSMIGTLEKGGLAQFVKVPYDNILVVDGINPEEAALIEPLAVAAHGVMKGKPKLGDKVVVFGAGTIGMMVVKWLMLHPVSEVMVVDIDQRKLTEIKEAYQVTIINGLEAQVEDVIRKRTNGLGADIVFECAGSVIAQEESLKISKKQGKVIYLGISYSDLHFKKDSFERIFRHELNVSGSWNAYSAPFPGEEWKTAVQFLKEGKITVKDMISHRFSLCETNKAFQLALEGTDFYKKILILPEAKR